MTSHPFEILLVEDNPADVRLTQMALASGKKNSNLNVSRNGHDALMFLQRKEDYGSAPRPNLVLLDLNLPRKNGHEVLTEMKADQNLKSIPVVVLSTSESEVDITKSYDLCANCYVSKSSDLDRFIAIIHAIEEFWLRTATLPCQ